MADKGNKHEQADMAGQLRDLYQELLQEGVLEDMELYHIDPIRMVSQEMANFIRTITGDSTAADQEPEQEQPGDTAVFASTILAAAEAQPQQRRPGAGKNRLEEIKAPLKRSVDLLTRIIEDESAVRVSKEALRQNVEILMQCLSRLDRVE